ncbi:TLC domain-containing protein 2 [Paragonimus heterotremus]|uniref:TLC domain-containing protein 2 n=1 Tax=Paragonimus heterotremus TaxID=100268 RepID=A0A8J4TCK4_9TREM|nr:TLC domain-containing protein 2 [Paragonimus heterotremus]
MEWHSWFPAARSSYGLIAIPSSILFFYTVDHALKGCTPPTIISAKGPNHVWKWRNMVVSWVHALLIGSWDILCFYYYPSLMNNLVDHVVPFTYYMVAISTGYFLFDFWEMVCQKRVLKMWELSLHHFAVLSTFIYNILTVKFIGYTVIALLAEVNSIFLHTRKLMQMHKVSFVSPVYRFNAVLNLLTFAGCRGYCLFRITYGMYTESHHMSFFYWTLLCVSMCIMNVLNPILFWILFRNDFLRTLVPGQLSKSELNNFTDDRNNIAYNNVSARFDGPMTLSPLGPKLRNNDLMIPELDLT